MEASEREGDQLFLLRSLAVLGQAQLFTGEPDQVAAAVEPLRRVALLGAAMGAADPAALGGQSDLAEALAVNDRETEAEEVCHAGVKQRCRVGG